MNDFYQYNNPQPDIIENLDYKELKKQAQRAEKREIMTAGFALGGVIIAYLFLQSIAVSFLKATPYMDTYSRSSMFQNLFNVLAIHLFSMLLPFGALAIALKKRFVTPVIPARKLSAKSFFAWVTAGITACYIANFCVGIMIQIFNSNGYELVQGEYLEPQSLIECLALIVSTSIIPGVIEELSLRCFGMGILRRHGKPFAVLSISIVFGLLHGNIIQFVFAFVIGLMLAYITIRTESVIPAMVVHAINNGFSVLQTTVSYLSGEDVGSVVTSIVYLAIAISGIFGLIYLFKNNEFLPPKSEKKVKSPFALNFFTKILFFLPGMVFPLLILIALSMSTIVPK